MGSVEDPMPLSAFVDRNGENRRMRYPAFGRLPGGRRRLPGGRSVLVEC
jgi:hypothetical protein